MDYNKLLEKARKAYSECITGAEKRRLESIFPELAESEESEDERTRKDIIHYLGLVGKGDGDYAQPMIDRWIAWLEKQSEQNPAWSGEDKLNLKQAIYVCHQNGYTAVENWLKSLKPQSHWKPTDEQMEDLKYAINMVDKCCEDSLQSLYNELKKL